MAVLLKSLMMVWIAQITTATVSKVMNVDPSSEYCYVDQSSKLICDYASVSKPVQLQRSARHKRDLSLPVDKPIEIRGASVFRLSETICYKDITISNTQMVIVDDSYKKGNFVANCPRYELSLINSTITKIPVAVVRLDVLRSAVKKLVPPPNIKRVSVFWSHIKFFSTEYPLNGSTFVNISYSNVTQVEKLQVAGQAKIQFLASNVTLMRMDGIKFQKNATVNITKSRLISPKSVVLNVDPYVLLILEDVIGKVTIKSSLKTLPDANKQLKNVKTGNLAKGKFSELLKNPLFIAVVALSVVLLITTILVVYLCLKGH